MLPSVQGQEMHEADQYNWSLVLHFEEHGQAYLSALLATSNPPSETSYQSQAKVK
jgi:hypothetical protein